MSNMDDISNLVHADIPSGWTVDEDTPPIMRDMADDTPFISNGKKNGSRPTVVKDDGPKMPRAGIIAKGVTKTYVMAGMGLGMFLPNTGLAIANEAEKCGAAWESLAASNPAVRKVILDLLETSDWAGIAVAHFPIVVVAAGEIKVIGERRRLAREESESEYVAETISA